MPTIEQEALAALKKLLDVIGVRHNDPHGVGWLCRALCTEDPWPVVDALQSAEFVIERAEREHAE
jgi:hypothetical protein